MDLYRYISFESFVDLVIGSQLTFVSPLHKWDDKCEGFLYQALKSHNGKNLVEEIANRFNKTPMIAEKSITYHCDKVRCQCWSEERDSVAMWSIYSHNDKAVMISADSDSFKKLGVILSKIQYSDKIELEEEIERCLNEKVIKPKQIFTVKRKAFEHEKEHRAFVRDIKNCNGTEDKKVDIDDLGSFIKGVLVHPKARRWYVSTVELFCKEYGLNFEGQSKIYDFSI